MQTSTIFRIIYIWTVEALLLFFGCLCYSWVHFQFIILMGSCTLQNVFSFSIYLDNWATFEDRLGEDRLYCEFRCSGQTRVKQTGVGSSEQGARRICPIGGRTHAVIIPSRKGVVVSLDVGTMNFLARSFGTCSLGLEEFCCELRCRNKM